MAAPLSGIRVLDLTRLLPGAICTLMLADLGADVIKIESPDGGDYARMMTPSFFAMSNRDKRSTIINLKSPEGAAVLRRLASNADVLVESYRPGVLKKLGCDYAALSAINPRLVFCSMSGWGQTGPNATRGDHDLNYVSVAGMTGAMGEPQPMGGQIADVGGSYAAVAGIMAALFRREREGVGAYIDISLFESALPFAAIGWAEALHYGFRRGEGSLTGGLACYNVYVAKDGHRVSLAALEPKFWTNFCATVDRTDLVDDYLLLERQRYLKMEVAEIFAKRSAEEWESLLYDADCCFTVVAAPDALANHPHVQARGMAGILPDGTPWMRSPIHVDSVPDAAQPPRGTAPDYGGQTRVILREAGFSDSDIESLITAKAVS